MSQATIATATMTIATAATIPEIKGALLSFSDPPVEVCGDGDSGERVGGSTGVGDGGGGTGARAAANLRRPLQSVPKKDPLESDAGTGVRASRRLWACIRGFSVAN